MCIRDRRWPVSRRTGQRTGSSRPANRSGRFGPCGLAVQETARPRRTPARAKRTVRSGLAELLKLDVAKLVNDGHLSLFAAGDDENNPDDAPQAAAEDRDDRVQHVVDRLALDQNSLEVALRLDPAAARGSTLQLLSEHRLAFVGRAPGRAEPAFRLFRLVRPGRAIPVALLAGGIRILKPSRRSLLAGSRSRGVRRDAHLGRRRD